MPIATQPPSPSTRDKLIEVARDLIYLQGYEATSVAEILDKAGVNSGSLYYYFKSKEELLLAVLDSYKEMLWPVLLEPIFTKVGDPVERIFALLDGYRRGLEYTACTAGCPIGNLALELSDHPRVREKIAENFDGWCRAIQKCLDEAEGRFPPQVDRAKLSKFILTVMEGGVMQARAHGSIEPFDACVEHLRDYVARLMTTAEPAGSPGAPNPEQQMP
jgi:TetR/AcrR family transcriptional repressor of nem operon